MRYRLLNEPGAAKSVCHDILRADSGNQQALVILLLALSDRFGKGYAVGVLQAGGPRAAERSLRTCLLRRILSERRAKARLHNTGPGAAFGAYELLREAMASYEKAEAIRPAGNDDALLRWNACARIIMQNRLEPRIEERVELQLE